MPASVAVSGLQPWETDQAPECMGKKALCTTGDIGNPSEPSCRCEREEKEAGYLGNCPQGGRAGTARHLLPRPSRAQPQQQNMGNVLKIAQGQNLAMQLHMRPIEGAFPPPLAHLAILSVKGKADRQQLQLKTAAQQDLTQSARHSALTETLPGPLVIKTQLWRACGILQEKITNMRFGLSRRRKAVMAFNPDIFSSRKKVGAFNRY
ncbi:hypothetical protein GOODEAATRI_023044 [Goodea atripinnis]|uniref:Uncharacterized protein n=1 Tax=Goodea atripinnis TaxID=208336 RepID=A0ABV0N525_9TELE